MINLSDNDYKAASAVINITWNYVGPDFLQEVPEGVVDFEEMLEAVLDADRYAVMGKRVPEGVAVLKKVLDENPWDDVVTYFRQKSPVKRFGM